MIVWTEYMLYRAKLRRFDIDQLEQIIKYSVERYFDTETAASCWSDAMPTRLS